MYACTSKHPLAINEEGGHEFEREQASRVGWKGLNGGKRGEETMLILTSKIKKKDVKSEIVITIKIHGIFKKTLAKL